MSNKSFTNSKQITYLYINLNFVNYIVNFTFILKLEIEFITNQYCLQYMLQLS